MRIRDRSIESAALLAAALALPACASAPRTDGFPDPAAATLKGGTYPNLDNVRAVVPGMSKDQLYHLLGRPHFGEGVFGVREWNYLFRIPGPGTEVSACQFKLSFDASYRVAAKAWSPQACEALLARTPATVTQVVEKEVANLSSDALFGFGSAELTAGGRRALDEALAGMDAGLAVERVRVVGHTDRIGDAAANDALSRRRAEAVGAYLADKGIAAAAIASEGRGEREPLVECADAPRSRLIACLAPNRRVEVSIRAMRE